MYCWTRIVGLVSCLCGLLATAEHAQAQPCDAQAAFCPPGTTCLVATNSTELLAHFATATQNAPAPYRIYICCEGAPYTFTLGQLQAPGSAILVDSGANVEIIGWCQGAPADAGEVVIQGPGPAISCDPAMNTGITPVEDSSLFRLFRVNDGRLSMTGLTLRRGAAWFSIPSVSPVSAGGAVNVGTNGEFDATDCIFEENLAASDGGAVFVEQGGLGDLNLNSCTFERNTALRQGGGVFTQRTANVIGGSFDCNFAGRPDNLGGPPYETSASGGAFYSDDANVTIARQTSPALGPVTMFTNNRATNGGAISFTATAERKVYEAQFFGNRARNVGGAMFAQNAANLALGFLNFGGPNAGEGNFAENSGGACYFQNFNKSDQPQVLGCRFEANSTNGSGGAVAHDTAVPGRYDHCFFKANTAVENGGAVDVRGTSRPEFNDCVFVQNSAGTGGVSGDGGAVSLISSRATQSTDADCKFYNCSFSRNTVFGPNGGANARGGTVYIEDSAPLFLHCTIAYEGTGQAGVYAIPPGSLPANFPRPRFLNSIVYRACRPGAQPCEDVFAAGPFAFAVSNGDFTYLDVRYSDIRVSSLSDFGVGNIDCDPLFVMSLGGAGSEDNVHLQPCSPCIDRALYSLAEERFTPPDGVFNDWPRPGNPPNPPSDVGSEDFDYDDLNSNLAGFVDDVFEFDLLGTRPSLFSFTDVLPDQRVATPRPSFCQADMGADEATTTITASLTATCMSREPGQSDALLDCDDTDNLEPNANCTYCVGDDVFIVPELVSTCPGDFEIIWYKRATATPLPCPPAMVPSPGDTRIDPGTFANITVLDDFTLCINDATSADTGCYYAVATRLTCGDTDLPPDFVLLGNCPESVVACACITVGTPPAITAQPQPSMVCDGTPTSLSVTANGFGAQLCYQWYRRDTPCDGPGTGGTPINGATSSTLSFLPARAQCPGEAPGAQDDNGYYYVVVSYCGASGDDECAVVTSTCARLTVFCPPSITGGGSAIVCGGGAAGGVQDCCYTIFAPDGCVPVVTWYKDLGVLGQEGDDIIVSTGSLPGVTISITPLGNNQYETCIIWDLEGLTNVQAQNLAGTYYVKAYCADPNCTTRSGNCTLTVRPQPVISVNPQDAAVCVGAAQCFNASITYSGTVALCWEWRSKPTCDSAGDGDLVASGTWTVGQSLNFEHCVPAASPADELCYYFRVRVCTPNDQDKCPWVASGCGCLDVREQLTPCELLCESGVTDTQGNCLYCPGAQILLCCEIASAEGPICYQWQKQTIPQVGVWEDIPGQTNQCLEIRSFDPARDATCYRVRINYSDLSGPNCPENGDKCNAVYSDPICLAPTEECCEIACPCKDNTDEIQDAYALWTTGEWDQVNGEWSFDRGTTDGIVIKAADDFFLCPSAMHRITTFTGKMLVRKANPDLELRAKLRIYKDCNGRPGELVEEFDSECAAFIESAPEGFSLHQFQFFFDCFWLKGGAYWASLVAIAPNADDQFEAFWVSTGLPGNPPTPTVMGMRPIFMEGMGDWQEYDPCCHPCTDLQFCIIGESCPIIWNNGKPYLGGADESEPANPPYDVFGTRSEKSTLTPRNSRAADQFVIKTCAEEEVCYIEGYIFTNCISFEAHLEIYENDCRDPDFMLPGGTPYYQRVATEIIDLEYDGLRVGSTNVRAYKVTFCGWPEALTFEPGKNYWISISVRDTFSAAERAYFAHVAPPCDACTQGNVWKIDPGKELAPGRQITDWQSAGADFAFLIATKKRPETLPLGPGDPRGGECAVDVDNNNVVDVADIFTFLSAWFAGCP
jgi:predicted outer membrane repeat protein